MSEKEITIRLIELYYNNVGTFKARCMTLSDLFERYKIELNKLRDLEGSNNE